MWGDTMFTEITYHMVFGLPLIVYGGVFTLLLFLATAVVAYGSRKGFLQVDVKWHYRLAALAVAAGVFHAVFGLLAYL
jgi:hypothetical protein